MSMGEIDKVHNLPCSLISFKHQMHGAVTLPFQDKDGIIDQKEFVEAQMSLAARSYQPSPSPSYRELAASPQVGRNMRDVHHSTMMLLTIP